MQLQERRKNLEDEIKNLKAREKKLWAVLILVCAFIMYATVNKDD
jgi:hypothetical protein